MNLSDYSQATIRDPYLLLRASALLEKRRRQAERRPKDVGIVSVPTFRGAGLTVQTYRKPEFILAGPSECLAGESLIYDPIANESKSIEWYHRNQIEPTVLTLYGPARASVPFIKGRAPLYRVTLENGKSFVATKRHRVLTERGWIFVGSCYPGLRLLGCGADLPESSSAPFRKVSLEDAQRYARKAQDSQLSYSACYRPYGGQPRTAEGNALDALPLQADVPGRSRDDHSSDVPESLSERSHHHQSFDRLSIARFAPCGLQPFASLRDAECLPVQCTDEHGFGPCQRLRLSVLGLRQRQPFDGQYQDFFHRQSFFSCSDYTVFAGTVDSIKYVRDDHYYDLTVPVFEHYLADGIWHHNTGKTWSTLWLLDSLLSQTPGAQAGLVRKVAADIVPTVLVTYKRVIQQSRSGALAYGGEKPEWFDYPNGAKLYIGGMDRPGKVLSGERDFIYVNQAEELTLDDWETLTTRTTGRGAVTTTPMLFGDCNPGPEDHWILKRDALKVFYSKHEDNPSLFDKRGNLTEQGKRTMAALDALTGIRKARLRYGKWVGAEGLFFEQWDEDIHTCEPFAIPGDWPIWGALDYGFSHPTAFGLFTEDNDGVIYLIGEHVQHKWLAVQHAKAIRRLAERLKISWHRVKQIVAGHDVFQQRGSDDGKTIADQYSEAIDPETGKFIGFDLEKATIARVPGAQELLARLGNADVKIKPTLKIFKDCKRTIATMTRMVCDPSDPEDVKKENADVNGQGGDDPYDMTRYGVMVKHQIPSRAPATAGKRANISVVRNRY